MSSLKNGEPAPEVDLIDTHGERWRLSDHRGKMVVIHCCRGEY